MEVIKEAGALAFRRADDSSLEVMLIRSRKNPSQWIFPKGHIEQGELEDEAAHRELVEEAGVMGVRIGFAGVLDFSNGVDTFTVAYHVFRYTRRDNAGEPGREPTWYSIVDALKTLSYKDTARLLEHSVQLIGGHL